MKKINRKQLRQLIAESTGLSMNNQGHVNKIADRFLDAGEDNEFLKSTYEIAVALGHAVPDMLGILTLDDGTLIDMVVTPELSHALSQRIPRVKSKPFSGDPSMQQIEYVFRSSINKDFDGRAKYDYLSETVFSEHKIKPGFPASAGVDDEMYGNIEGLASSGDESFRGSADVLASTLGYPGKSFSTDLADYYYVPPLFKYSLNGQNMVSELNKRDVDAFIKSYEFLVGIEEQHAQGNYSYDIEDAEDGLVGASDLIFNSIRNDTGNDDVYDLVFTGTDGYRQEELKRAFERYDVIDDDY